MKVYICEPCNFSSKIKTHFERHKKTKKHGVTFGTLEKTALYYGLKMTMTPNDLSMTQNDPSEICQKKKFFFLEQEKKKINKKKLDEFQCVENKTNHHHNILDNTNNLEENIENEKKKSFFLENEKKKKFFLENEEKKKKKKNFVINISRTNTNTNSLQDDL
jgi:hypothetical protein